MSSSRMDFLKSKFVDVPDLREQEPQAASPGKPQNMLKRVSQLSKGRKRSRCAAWACVFRGHRVASDQSCTCRVTWLWFLWVSFPNEQC
jgi:hypothetical protein